MEQDERVQRFLDALEADLPPAESTGALCGCWHALRGEWDAAHDAGQGDTKDDSWVHAALHREEGDASNAAYWYSRAGRPVPTKPVRQEYLEIAATLLRGS